MSFSFKHPYQIDPAYKRAVAYFCMEYGIHQPLKIYAGGLGYLSGSHMRSAYELKQNLVGVGILWKYGYYDQVGKEDQTMSVLFEEKRYCFLKETGIRFTVRIARNDVYVTAYYLPPELFHTAPLFLLSTDLPENDYLARSVTHKLYDANPETSIAASILLGTGGAKLLELLGFEPEVYHLNESHALPLAFYLLGKYGSVDDVRRRLVFTNHTPEEGGNRKTDIGQLIKMGFFCDIPETSVREIVQLDDNLLDYTLTALRFSGRANAVSKLHLETLRRLWDKYEGICELISITNAQNYSYWHNAELYRALEKSDTSAMVNIKKQCKLDLFEVVADQCGEIYDKDTCTIVFAKRFTGYKRPGLLFRDMDRFHRLVTNKEMPVQIIWAGKPYPMDYSSIGEFDHIVNICKTYSNCAALLGYELKLSKLLKRGADVWLNVPRLTHEASGTSGMAAAMNGAVNVGLPDGWFPEFSRHGYNSFVIPPCDTTLPDHEQDDLDADSLYEMLEQEVLPLYYNDKEKWLQIAANAMKDIIPAFDSNRMAREYYERLYTI